MRSVILGVMVFLHILIPGLAQGASQIAPRDGMWLSLPPDSVKCVVLRLPHDAGLSTSGNYIFTVSCEPDPSETWADLSEQLVREVSQNNTVLIPVCFDTAGSKPVGNCSTPYTIRLSEAYTGTERSWSGGVCISEYGDIDTVQASAETPGDVEDILNSHTDMVSAWFSGGDVYAEPGQAVDLNLSVQSYASLELEVSIESSLSVSPGQAMLSTSPASPQDSTSFTAEAPYRAGSYPVTARVNPVGCEESHCTELTSMNIHVGSEPPSGFEVKLNPDNIDIGSPREVVLTFSIINHMEEAGTFTTSLNIEPSDAVSGYKGESMEVEAYDSRTRGFTVTPGSSSKLYEVTVTVESDEGIRSATSFITIDEMVTDALRQAQGLGDEATAALDSWLIEHGDSEYGSDLEGYTSLKESLEAASQQDDATEPPAMDDDYPDDQDTQDDEPEPMDLTWLIFAVILGVIVILVVYFGFRKKGPGRQEGVDYY